MINYKHILRFLTKEGVGISIEEFLFLLCVRLHHEEPAADWPEVRNYIHTYYAQNKHYGKDILPQDQALATSWGKMIDKLVLQGYLVDYRKDKDIVSFTQLAVTETFTDKIWTNDREAVWKRLTEFVFENCGTAMMLPTGKQLGYFFVNQGDPIINNPEKLKDYFWCNICNYGTKFEIEQFFHDFEIYLQHNKLQMKISNFLINYHAGTLKSEIHMVKNKAAEVGSIFKRR